MEKINKEEFFEEVRYCFECPICNEHSENPEEPEVGNEVTCEHCEAEFEIES